MSIEKAHLIYKSKVSSAEAMAGWLVIPEFTGIKSKWSEQLSLLRPLALAETERFELSCDFSQTHFECAPL